MQPFLLRRHPTFFRDARKKYLPPLTFYWMEANENKPTVLCVVPKKLFPLATKRNRVKRQIKAFFTPFVREKNHILVVRLHTLPQTSDQIRQAAKTFTMVQSNPL